MQVGGVAEQASTEREAVAKIAAIGAGAVSSPAPVGQGLGGLYYSPNRPLKVPTEAYFRLIAYLENVCGTEGRHSLQNNDWSEPLVAEILRSRP